MNKKVKANVKVNLHRVLKYWKNYITFVTCAVMIWWYHWECNQVCPYTSGTSFLPVLQIIVVTWSRRICLICTWQYAWSLRAAHLTADGYVSGNKITSAHITSNMHQFWHSKNHPKLQLTALPIYICRNGQLCWL